VGVHGLASRRLRRAGKVARGAGSGAPSLLSIKYSTVDVMMTNPLDHDDPRDHHDINKIASVAAFTMNVLDSKFI
jgi:hypothetical protein